MNQDCIYWNTGCGQPILKPLHSRRSPYDHYFRSFCPYCQEYRQNTVKSGVTASQQVIVKHHYIGQAPVKPKVQTKSGYKGIK